MLVTTGLLLMTLGAAGFLFGLGTFIRSARSGKPRPGAVRLALDESWLTSAAVFAVGTVAWQSLEWVEGAVVFGGAAIAGLFLKLALAGVFAREKPE
jgi:hypothetical protein